MSIPRITWKDIQELPEDGNRYEAIDGALYLTPAPSLLHQTVSLRIELALAHLLVGAGHGHLWHAPLGVVFPDTGEAVQPDIVFLSHARRAHMAPEGLRGAPDLVVEITSPATAERDRGIKRRLYGRQGVEEYWIVDPDERSVEVWRFGATPEHERFTARVPVRLGDETLGEIPLDEAFGEPEAAPDGETGS